MTSLSYYSVLNLIIRGMLRKGLHKYTFQIIVCNFLWYILYSSTSQHWWMCIKITKDLIRLKFEIYSNIERSRRSSQNHENFLLLCQIMEWNEDADTAKFWLIKWIWNKIRKKNISWVSFELRNFLYFLYFLIKFT